MEFPILHFVIGVIFFFPILYFVVIPVIQNVSLKLFNKRFKVGGFISVDYMGEDPVKFFDVLLTFLSFAIALVLTGSLVLFAGKAGIIPEFPVKK